MMKLCYNIYSDRDITNKFNEVFNMMNWQTLLHIMKEDYNFTFRVTFSFIGEVIVDLNINHYLNPAGKVIYFINTLNNYGFTAKRFEEEEETHFFNDDHSITIRISD